MRFTARDSENLPMSDESLGRFVTFHLNHAHRDWTWNEQVYVFDPIEEDDFEMRSTKHQDRTLEVQILGPFNQSFKFRHPLPLCDTEGLMVTIAWNYPEVMLYFNEELIEEMSVE